MAIDMTSIQNNPACSLYSKTYLPKDPKKAQEIYELFNGGKDLFPKGELISIIERKIKGNKILNETLFLRYCRLFRKDKKDLKERLTRLGYQVKFFDECHINDRILAKMECEIYNDIIPWIKENIFYRKVCNKPNAFYSSLFPQSLQ